jgi:hypothetical protein
VWDDLDAIEQSLLTVAAGERTLDLACTSWAAPPLSRGVVKMTMRAAGRLHELGLIGFYRIEDGYPDLGEHELGLVFSDRSHWECGPDDAGRVDIPCRLMSSRSDCLVLPSGLFVVLGTGLQTAVQDADEAVRELPESRVVTDLPGPERVVIRPRTGRSTERRERLLVKRVAKPTVRGIPSHDDGLLP